MVMNKYGRLCEVDYKNVDLDHVCCELYFCVRYCDISSSKRFELIFVVKSQYYFKIIEKDVCLDLGK